MIDLTTRLFVEPTIYGDVEMLKQLVIAERTRKETTAQALGVDEAVFRSTKRFVALLESLGEIVATKPNAKGLPIPAIDSKSIYMRDLMERDDYIGDLANAKIDLGSAINEKRAEKILAKASAGRPLPIQLKPYGTVTARWSGAGDKMNFQNMPRDGQIRNCLVAPPGYTIVDIDLSQIEYRTLCALAGQTDKLEALRNGRDLYSEQATKIYGRIITKATDEEARNVGKQGTLSCGFGAGKDGKTFQKNCRAKGLKISIEIAQKAVETYRATHPLVVQFWKECDRILRCLMTGGHYAEVGPIQVEKGALILPNGLRLPYLLKYDSDGRQFLRAERGKTGAIEFKKTYGAKLSENLASSIARVILSDTILAIKTELGLRPFLTVNDSLAYLVPEGEAGSVASRLPEIAQRTPVWWKRGAPALHWTGWG